MARPTLLINEIEQCIAITVDTNLVHLLDVVARFTLLPQFVAAPGIIMRQPHVLDCSEGFWGNVGEHQYVTRIGVLRDSGNQSVSTKI